MLAVFSFHDYKRFIYEKISENSAIRGYKSRLAEAAGCSLSYFSGVLNHELQLTQDQAYGLTAFWELDEEATDYFLILIDLAKSPTIRLKRHLEGKLQSIRMNRDDIAKFANQKSLNSEEILAKYYSSWHMAAVHILTSIPKYNEPSVIALRLGLSIELVEKTLNMLLDMGLVVQKEGFWRNLPGGLHLPRQSPHALVLHNNWRQRALLDAVTQRSKSIHYTSVQSHSVADLLKLYDKFLATLENARELITPSPNEELSCICIDFFTV